jgi:UDPglucose 6-dehydrogenase
VFGARIRDVEKNYDAVAGADALVVITEWKQYRVPDFTRMRELMRQPIIVDGRNLYSPARLQDLGFDYSSIGRPGVSSGTLRAIAT